jgi:hypothetical protein
MTSAAQQPQREHIITEKDWEESKKIFTLTHVEDKIKLLMLAGILDRSRPHPPAPEQEWAQGSNVQNKKELCPFYISGCAAHCCDKCKEHLSDDKGMALHNFRIDPKPKTCNGCDSISCAEVCMEWQKQHNTAIARTATLAAYDKFLDEVRKEEFDNCGYVDMDSVEAVYIRIRQSTTAEKQEEHHT